MKIDQLIYFAETARQEHIGRASRLLGISPSAISHSIASLEGELGQKLFEKKGKNIVLTDEGRRVFEKSQDLIAGFQNLRQELLGAKDEKNHYKGSASHYLSRYHLAPVWAELGKTYQETSMEIMTYRSAEVLRSVLAREVDFGVCFSPQPHPELEARVLFEGELFLALRKNHPLTRVPVKDALRELSAVPAVLPKAFQGIDVCLSHPMFARHQITPRPMVLTDSYDVSIELIKKGDHWGLLPEFLIQKNGLATIRPGSWKAPYNVSMIYLKKRFIPEIFRDMEQLLIRTF